MPLARLLLALILGGVVPACDTETDARVRWRLSITSLASDAFGVRIFLDGKEVFAQTTVLSTGHTATVEGRYPLQQHVVEYEIAGVPRAGRYVAGVEYTILPEGRAAIVDGVPTEVNAGERLRLVVDLAGERRP